MRRQRTSLVALALALFALAIPTAGSAQQASMRGTFALDRQASDDINAAIERAVARMNFVTRPIARGRLRRTNAAYNRVVVDFDASEVSIKFDNRDPVESPANGTPVRWTREDGEVFNVSTEWENGRLEQTFAAEDGQRVNTYSLSEDGNTLTMNVRITSPRLSSPLTYKLVFNRAS